MTPHRTRLPQVAGGVGDDFGVLESGPHFLHEWRRQLVLPCKLARKGIEGATGIVRGRQRR